MFGGQLTYVYDKNWALYLPEQEQLFWFHVLLDKILTIHKDHFYGEGLLPSNGYFLVIQRIFQSKKNCYTIVVIPYANNGIDHGSPIGLVFDFGKIKLNYYLLELQAHQEAYLQEYPDSLAHYLKNIYSTRIKFLVKNGIRFKYITPKLIPEHLPIVKKAFNYNQIISLLPEAEAKLNEEYRFRNKQLEEEDDFVFVDNLKGSQDIEEDWVTVDFHLQSQSSEEVIKNKKYRINVQESEIPVDDTLRAKGNRHN